MISYTMKSIMISYMKYGYDIMISYSVISCVIYACIYDRLDYDIMGMISYLDYDIIGNLKSYVMVS